MIAFSELMEVMFWEVGVYLDPSPQPLITSTLAIGSKVYHSPALCFSNLTATAGERAGVRSHLDLLFHRDGIGLWLA